MVSRRRCRGWSATNIGLMVSVRRRRSSSSVSAICHWGALLPAFAEAYVRGWPASSRLSALLATGDAYSVGGNGTVGRTGRAVNGRLGPCALVSASGTEECACCGVTTPLFCGRVCDTHCSGRGNLRRWRDVHVGDCAQIVGDGSDE